MLKLMIHADDFGMSEKINAGIIEAHKNGIVTSTSIMANGKAFKNAVEIAKNNPSLDLGIHLTLIEEEPILPPGEIKTLLNSEMKFFQDSTMFTKQYISRKIDFNEVKKELEKQICMVLDQGLKITHFDSHNHMHMLPKILKKTIELAKKYNIPAIRFPKENFRFFMLRNINSYFRTFQMIVLNTICFFEGEIISKMMIFYRVLLRWKS